MPVFQRTANDKTTRLDKDAKKLALVFEENTNIELADAGLEILVDSDDPGIVEVTSGPIPTVNTYAVRGARSDTHSDTCRALDIAACAQRTCMESTGSNLLNILQRHKHQRGTV